MAVGEDDTVVVEDTDDPEEGVGVCVGVMLCVAVLEGLPVPVGVMEGLRVLEDVGLPDAVMEDDLEGVPDLEGVIEGVLDLVCEGLFEGV